MSANPKPSLVLLDSENGEIKAPCQRCPEHEQERQRLEDVISGLQRDIRGWSARYEELKRDKAQSAKHHKHYSEVEIAFREWKRLCNHPRSQFTADRFWLALPYYENKEYGLKMMIRAVKGAAFDPFITTRRNGTTQRHDGWELIFRDAGKFEEFVNKAPREGES